MGHAIAKSLFKLIITYPFCQIATMTPQYCENIVFCLIQDWKLNLLSLMIYHSLDTQGVPKKGRNFANIPYF